MANELALKVMAKPLSLTSACLFQAYMCSWGTKSTKIQLQDCSSLLFIENQVASDLQQRCEADAIMHKSGQLMLAAEHVSLNKLPYLQL